VHRESVFYIVYTTVVLLYSVESISSYFVEHRTIYYILQVPATFYTCPHSLRHDRTEQNREKLLSIFLKSKTSFFLLMSRLLMSRLQRHV
jgi:hypothetical protein